MLVYGGKKTHCIPSLPFFLYPAILWLTSSWENQENERAQVQKSISFMPCQDKGASSNVDVDVNFKLLKKID